VPTIRKPDREEKGRTSPRASALTHWWRRETLSTRKRPRPRKSSCCPRLVKTRLPAPPWAYRPQRNCRWYRFPSQSPETLEVRLRDWRQLLEQNPARAERNRQCQRKRDERRRQRRLANNNSAPNLANNNPAIRQIIESKALNPSCQQQPSGQRVTLCPIKGSEPCSPPTRSTICIT
jgi:hypothetical protein